MAAGAQADFFGTPGATEHSLPLYSVNDAERLRARLLDVLDSTMERPELIDRGSSNFVIVGGGPTGVETAVAFAAWLGVHAMLLSGTRNKIDAFMSWGWDHFSKDRATAMVDRPDAARID